MPETKEVQTHSDHEAQAKDRFDAWSDSSTFQRLRPWLEMVQRNVLGRFDWGRIRGFLDIACGSGWAAAEAARLAGPDSGSMACGCDISIGMLRRAAPQARQGSSPHLLAASAQALPYRSASFDGVICTAAFHHFPSPVEALQEVRRVLRPGGTVVVADTCRDQSIGTWIWDRLHRWFEPGHVKYYRRDELREIFQAAGFQDLKVTELHPTFRETKKLVRRVALFEATAPRT